MAGLHLSEGTVKNYVSAIYLKLGASHRAEAVRISRDEMALLNLDVDFLINGQLSSIVRGN
jgi:hypothetical protein